MADIFISNSSEDRTKVEGIVAALTATGLTVWYDHDLAGGSVLSEEIEKELKAAKIVLAVWTAASLKSRWVVDEAEIGRDSGKLIPITLDGSIPPIGFRQYQAMASEANEKIALSYVGQYVFALGGGLNRSRQHMR